MDYTAASCDWRPEQSVGELPCQNCGTLVTVHLPFIGCVFCEECSHGISYSDAEDFHSGERINEE